MRGRKPDSPPVPLDGFGFVSVEDMIGVHGWTERTLAEAFSVDLRTIQYRTNQARTGRENPAHQREYWFLLQEQRRLS